MSYSEQPTIFRIPGLTGDASMFFRGRSERLFPKRTDGYKPSHWLFYEDGITEMYDYLTSRGGKFQKLMMFGAQAHIMKYLCGQVVTPEQVRRANKFYTKYYNQEGVFNYEGWMDIATRLKGRLPLRVFALPEGLSGVPVQTPMMSYINTDPKHAWLSGYLEPLMFKVWNTITVATLSQHIKKVIYECLLKTGTPADIIWKLHDFGYRGVSSEESAEYAGGSHLVNFWGSDTIPAIDWVNEFYSNGEFDEDGDPTYMPAYSVRATEHSVMTHRGLTYNAELETVRDILKKCPTGIIAMVGDSRNIFEFADKIIGTDLHTEVIEREGVVIIRPDSGDPISTMMKVNWHLGERFGFTVNSKGYRIFGKESDGSLGKVKTLQGDKNDYDPIYNMCRAYEGARWSLDNLATFGMGGALLQKSTRDDQNMAIKLSSLTGSDGKWRNVSKDPITDPGKYSKFGRFAVIPVVDETGEETFKTIILNQGDAVPQGNLLNEIFCNGDMIAHSTFVQVRERADAWMAKAQVA